MHKGGVVGAAKAGSMFGKYQLTRLLGQGGMGEVYEAHDTSKDRTVALKILPEELSRDEGFRTRFQRESRAAAMLEEPHVIPIHDWGEIDGNLYIDMRLVRGQDLHELLQRGPLEPERAVGIIRQIGAALDAAHAQGLIHRDVKPPNILITAAEDFAYLIDFGIAENRGDTRLTVAGSAIGSFAYMAPERFEDHPTTPAVDTYSLAGVLFEALTGQPPYKVGSMDRRPACNRRKTGVAADTSGELADVDLVLSVGERLAVGHLQEERNLPNESGGVVGVGAQAEIAVLVGAGGAGDDQARVYPAQQ
jgi:serine/threonine-protein kinase